MMPKLLILLVALLAAAFLAACAGSASDSTPTVAPTAETPTPTEAPGGGGGGGGGTLVPITTPFPAPPPVPAEWRTYTDADGLFTLRYPPTWFQRVGSLYSADPSTRPDRGFPPDSIEVEIGYIDAAISGGGCGLLSIHPQSGELLFDEPEVAPATLDGVSGGQILRVFDPAELGLTRIHGINVIYKGYCFQITAYFVQENPDEATFLQIAGSFRFIQ